MYIYLYHFRNLQKVRSKTSENAYIPVCRSLVIVVYSEANNKDSTYIPRSSLTHHRCDTQMDEQEVTSVCTYIGVGSIPVCSGIAVLN